MAFISNGTTILDNGAFDVNLGSMVLLSEQTASSSANISFTSGIDSTYPIYKFEYINCHPQTDGQNFQVNFRDGGSNYDATKTTTAFTAYHNESDSATSLEYESSNDLAEATGFQTIVGGGGTGNDNDQSVSGILYLFNPSSTTFVKHFLNTSHHAHNNNFAIQHYVSGYCNTTSAIDGVQFKFASGNIDAGTIKLYGIKDS